ncbi:MAG: GNAT family N-acetyltransferase [Gammaproteobacteria bacterium]|jgi:putative acetyltransferase|nr:GNAT family N-acetyltransferase [Gammaproteobacteria bacterium]
MHIRIDDLSGPEIAAFLEDHIRDMKSVSPPESKHALDLDGLRKPEITFWTVWDEQVLVGCGALKELDKTHAEIKSMRVSGTRKQQGIASMLLRHMLDQAAARGYRRLSLETGSMPFFEPARRLYTKFGFQPCAPFSGYKDDPNSVFMNLDIQQRQAST